MRSEPAHHDPALIRLLDAVRRRMVARRMLALASRNALVALLLVLAPVLLTALHSTSRVVPAAAILCGAAFIAAAIQAGLGRPVRIDVALHVDRRFRLQERLSSLICTPPENPLYAALRADALASVRDITAAAACPVSIPRSAPVTAAIAFAVAALVFGPAQSGSAGRQPPQRNEVEDILSAVRVELPAGLQQELAKAAGNDSDDLDAAAARLDDLLGKLDAFDRIRKSLRPQQSNAPLDPQDTSPESVEKLIGETPDARSRIQAALAQASKALESDPELKQALDNALATLAGKSDSDLASSLSALLDKLAAKAAQQNVDRLKRLRSELAALRKSAEQEQGFRQGVTRVLISGAKHAGDPGDDTGSRDGRMVFSPDAVLKARAAVDSGATPARYRWVVEKYFAQDE
ncbi:MAG TPA: hypothetical protein VM223_21745 [Planctomycetota bacterium]|nr:hypothetical protein [Planctomycetota bacterium]